MPGLLDIHVEDLRSRLPQPALDLLDSRDGGFSEMSTACKIATYAMNSDLTADDYVALVSASDFAYEFATENGRDRASRLESRLRKVWGRVENVWQPPMGSAEGVRSRLESLSQRLAAHRWSGRTGNSDRAVSAALVQRAHELGVWTLDISERDLSVRAGVSRTTVGKSLQRLQILGVLRRDADTRRQGNHSQRWLLNMDWAISDITGPHNSVTGGQGLCGLVVSLNHPAFLRSALGQSAERIWLDLIDYPDSTAAEIAQRIGVVVRTAQRNLQKLEASRLVTKTGTKPTGRKPAITYRINPDGRLDDVAEEHNVSDWHERTTERYDRERQGYAEVQRQRATTSAPAEPQADVEPEKPRPSWPPAFGEASGDTQPVERRKPLWA